MPGAAAHSDVHADHRIDPAASPHTTPTHAAGAPGDHTGHAGTATTATTDTPGTTRRCSAGASG